MDTDCTFCRLYDEGAVIYEDEFFYGRFDKYPITAGHAEIIPKQHIADMDELSGEMWQQLQHAIDGVKEAIEDADLGSVYSELIDDPLDKTSEQYCQDVLDDGFYQQDPDAYNIGVNDGEAAGRTVDHLHIHIIPRYDGDMDDPRGGVRYIVPEKGNYRA